MLLLALVLVLRNTGDERLLILHVGRGSLALVGGLAARIGVDLGSILLGDNVADGAGVDTRGDAGGERGAMEAGFAVAVKHDAVDGQ